MLRRGNQLVDVELPLRDRRQHEGAGHVGVVAADQRAEVDLDEVARRQHCVGRPVVRDRRVGPGRHDGLERHAVGAVVEHQRLEFAAYLFLRPARAQPAALDEVRQRGVGRLARQPQQRDLARVLDLAQRLHRSRGPDQLSGVARGLAQGGEPVDGHHVAFKPQPAHAVLGGAPGQMRPARPLDDDLRVRGLLRGLGAIATVGGQHRRFAVGADQQRRIRTREAGQITHVDQVGYQHRVQFGVGQPLAQPVPALRNSHSR